MVATDAAVLIPLRSFDDAKTRLAGVLTPDDRRRLAMAMAERVVRAARDLPVYVVSDDADVLRWAERLGANGLAPAVNGLNESIDAAIALVATEDDPPSRVIVAHADLPLADDLRVVDGPGLAIAPDQARDGSNVLSIPLTSGFTFHYGPGSFAAHCAEAERLGLEITVVDDPSLALDVDDPGDLAHLQVEGS